MKSILNLLPIETMVIYDGQPLKVSSLDVIVRDIIKISIRNKVPANMRLLSTSRDVRFNRLMLTGESDKVEGAINITNINAVKDEPTLI
jgi:sodium/potassium-transporting ATPase subunit alpha